MIDSHCHIQHPQYDTDREEVIKRTLADNCSMICIGSDLESSKQAIKLAKKYNNIWATIGLHPNDGIVGSDFNIFEFEKLLENKKVMAIGEVGLDYYRIVNPIEKQKEIFKQFIELAIRKNLPLVIHSRDAFDDVFSMFKTYSSKLKAVVHSFNGTPEQAQLYIDLGFYIGLNGIITFSDSYTEMVRQIPLERLLIETDAPFLAPPPYRGKRNEPLYVKYVAEKIAEIKKEPVEKIYETTTQNTKKLFKI